MSADAVERKPQYNAPLVEVHIGLFADNVGVSTTNTLDLGQGVHDFTLSVNIGVEQTQNVLWWKFNQRFNGLG